MTWRAALFATIVVLVTAQTALPATDSAGFSAHATIGLTAYVQERSLRVDGLADFERSGTRVRIALSSLSIASGSASGVTNLLPPGGYTVVVETSTMRYTVWSAAKRSYFTGSGRPVTAAPTPAPEATKPPEKAPSPLSRLKDLRAFSLSVDLVADKQPVDGHPTTAFDFKVKQEGRSGGPIAVAGRINFADDLEGTPVLLTVNATRGAPVTGSADLTVALTGVRRASPPDADFSPPADYAKAQSLLDVLVMPSSH